MTLKSLEKINLRKKTEGILLLDITNWYWAQQLFGYLIWSLYVDTKCHIFTVGSQNIAHVCQNLEIVEGISQPTGDAKSCGFFYSKELGLENDLKF